MKLFLCLCVLFAIAHSIPVAKEEPKKPLSFAPVEGAEDTAAEEGVDLKAAEAAWGYGYRGHGYGGYGGYGGYYGGWGHRRHGWGGYGSYSRESFSASDFFG
ncbi:uncharacterized protein LOC132259510 [Phlebotomus argentipes]|uniref:uncharacterized protein LOC132259510 n=1 Tax=Phlebotomus argentipes TaxID=94469 RepID=UPI002892C7A3|nr:uncharacterized protein LOC132259510 [Phlebotomus argentipes]